MPAAADFGGGVNMETGIIVFWFICTAIVSGLLGYIAGLSSMRDQMEKQAVMHGGGEYYGGFDSGKPYFRWRNIRSTS